MVSNRKGRKKANRKGRLVLFYVPPELIGELDDLVRAEPAHTMTSAIAWALHQQWLLLKGHGPEHDDRNGNLIF